MVDLIDEAREDLERERWLNLWKRIGTYVVALSVAIVVITAGSVLWQNHMKSKRESAALAYGKASEAARSGEWDVAVAEYEKSANAGAGGISASARIQKAQLLTETGKTDEATALLQAVAKDGDAGNIWNTLAALRLAVIQIDQGAERSATQKLLDPIAKKETAFGSFHARELLAYADMKAGEIEAARTRLQTLAVDAATPAGLRTRARSALASLPATGESLHEAE